MQRGTQSERRGRGQQEDPQVAWFSGALGVSGCLQCGVSCVLATALPALQLGGEAAASQRAGEVSNRAECVQGAAAAHGRALSLLGPARACWVAFVFLTSVASREEP